MILIMVGNKIKKAEKKLQDSIYVKNVKFFNNILKVKYMDKILKSDIWYHK